MLWMSPAALKPNALLCYARRRSSARCSSWSATATFWPVKHFCRSGMTGLSDPTVLHWAGPNILLSHGDALCLDDVEYQQFRAVSRSAAWQQQLLAQPLTIRRAIGKSARSESEQRKQSDTPYADADAQMSATWMQAAQAPWLIHGHTHQPADHALGNEQWRIVLSDWHIDGDIHRAEVLRVTPEGWQRIKPEQAGTV